MGIHWTEGPEILDGGDLASIFPSRIALARRLVHPVTLALVRVDGANGTDAVVLGALRGGDQVFRLGDGMLALILEDTDADGGAQALQRVIETLGQAPFNALVHAGIADFPRSARDAASLHRLALMAFGHAASSEASQIEVAPET